ncbi:MAG: peptidylprolyl isomerase [Erythrobacter sp.]
MMKYRVTKWAHISRCNWNDRVFFKLTKNTLLLAAATSLVSTPIAVNAQQAATQAPAAQPAAANPLGIPQNVAILGNNNPNERSATAIVNGQVITGTDIEQRVALVTSASQNQISDQERQRLRMQVLRNLIDETLQIQAAREQEVAPATEEINQTYARVASQNFGTDLAAMDKYLASVGSSASSLKRQIQGELSWSNLQRRNVRPFVNVSEEEAKEVLAKREADRGTDEYRIGEIYLSATAENKQAVFQNGQRIMEQLRQGGSFVAYARQFSESSTASVGGDLGFVRLNTLPAAMAQSARSIQAGELVGPIEIPGGFVIMYLIDKRQVAMADPRDAMLSLKQVSISFPAGTTEAAAASKVETFTTGVAAMRGCGDAEAAAAGFGASVVTNDGIRARSLPEQLQQLVLGLQVGQSTPPFGSIQDGVRVLMLCGRDDPAAAPVQSIEQIVREIEEERVGKRAQRYLRDLRNDAYIEYN